MRGHEPKSAHYHAFPWEEAEQVVVDANGKTIVIGGEEFSRDRFEELVLAVDAALDRRQ